MRRKSTFTGNTEQWVQNHQAFHVWHVAKKINKKEPRVHPTNPELHTSTYRKKNLLQCFLLKKKNSIEAWFQRSLASPAFISNLDKQGYSRFLKLIVVVGETRRPVWEVRSHEAYRREKETEDTHSH